MRIVSSLLATLTAWVVVLAWSPMVSHPSGFTLPLLAVAVIVGSIGAGLRALRAPAYAVVPAQLVACGVYLVAHFTPGPLPTLADASSFASQVQQGSITINSYAAPVAARFGEVFAFLAVCGVAIIVLVDLIASGLRRVPAAGLPLLIALTVPISVLVDRLAWPVFILGTTMFLLMLALDHAVSLRSWGRTHPAESTDDATKPPHLGARRPADVPLGAVIAATTILGALLLPFVVPVSAGGVLRPAPGNGPGNGINGITLVNPILDLRRDLISKSHTPLVYATTDDPDPRYLQLTVLDQFDGQQWAPSKRNLPAANKVKGPMPQAPGLGVGISGRRTDWQLQLGATYRTSWLPLPYPATSVKVGGDWRYDSRTLDVVDVGRSRPTQGMQYSATGFLPDITANGLDATYQPPGRTLGPYTRLPSKLPQVIIDQATRVTASGTTSYQRAVLLQNWFRENGGFTYSTAAAPGAGMDLLAHFVTDDRVGYCEQFAAAMAVMGRVLNIPSRVVVGFLEGERQQAHHFLFTTDELHAWPEFYFPGSGWVVFEPTPGGRSGSVAPAYTRPGARSDTPDANPTTLPTARPAPQQQAPVHKEPTSTAPSEGGLPWGWLILVLAAVALAATPRLLRVRGRRRRLAHEEARALAAGAWAELRATALDLDIDWPERRSPRESAARLRARVSADTDLVRQLDQLATFVERARYGREFSITREQATDVRRTVLAWSEAMRRAASERAASRAKWLPQSVFERTGDPQQRPDPEVGVRTR